MSETSTFESLPEILWVNLVLSADNAISLGMLTHHLPARRRAVALFLAGLGAIAVRVPLTGVVAALMTLPGLKLAGGLGLLVIGINLLLQETDEQASQAVFEVSLFRSVLLIITTDFVMSLDNVMAVAAISQGNLISLVLGLSAGIALVMGGGGLLGRLAMRWPVLIYAGAAIIALTAGQMLVGDPLLTGRWSWPSWVNILVQGAAVVVVLSAPRWWPGLAALWPRLTTLRRRP